MAADIWETAVRDLIRADLGYSNANCEIMDGPEPKAVTSFFVSVHDGDLNQMEDWPRQDVVSLSVTISLKTGQIPRDQIKLKAVESGGISKRARDIANLIHMNYPLMAVVNSAVFSDTELDVSGYYYPLKLTAGYGKLQTANAAFFGASEVSDPRARQRTQGQMIAGIYVTIPFGEAKRYQNPASQS